MQLNPERDSFVRFKILPFTHIYLLQNMEIALPDYLTISDYKKIISLEHLSETEKMIEQVSILTKIDKDEIRTWKGDSVMKIIDKIYDLINGAQPEFFPLIEFEGKTYGFASLSRMTLGEYVDLENLCKDPNRNLSEIMALLYREVTENKFNTFKWKIKSRVKLAIGKTEDLFKYYKIKPYSSDERQINADTLESFPVQYILGALFFFTLIRTEYLNDTLLSSNPQMTEISTLARLEMKNLMLSIGGGLAQFMVLAKATSFQSQETSVLLT